jgi:hypothetical protein
MKIRTIILLLIIFSAASECFGQGTDMRAERKPGTFIGFSAGIINPEIVHTSSLKLENDEGSMKSTFSGFFDFGYMFSKIAGLKTGIIFNSYKANLSLSSYSDVVNLKDDENDTYELRVTGSNITETESFRIVRIPVGLILNIPFSGTFSLFAEPDLGISVPFGAKFTSTGLFTYKGYYPEYNVLLENLPNHKFWTNKTVMANGEPEMKKSFTDFSVYGGFGIMVNRKLQIKAGIRYSKTLSGISGYDSAEKFHLSPAGGEVVSLMGGSSDVTAKYLGFGISVRYFINR